MRDKILLLVRKYPAEALAITFVFLLLLKFFRSFVIFEMPLGYDVGLYRYLFLKYASTSSFLELPVLQQWEREHPPILLYLVSLVIRSGISVDWFIGWIWNTFSIVLLLLYAHIAATRYTKMVGAALLGMSLLSLAYFDAFAAMYWKSFAGLFCCLLVFNSLEHKKWLLAGVFIIISAGTHHQTTLLMMLAIIPWWLAQGWNQRKKPKKWIGLTLLGVACVCISLLWYVHSIDFVIVQIKSLALMARTVYGGAFPEPSFYVGRMFLLIALSIFGFYYEWKSGSKWTLWQCAFLWSAIFVFLKLHFYRRFFLHFDFFLLLFAAQGIVQLWKISKDILVRFVILLLLGIQVILATNRAISIAPTLNHADFMFVQTLHNKVENDTKILVPENASAMWVLGWLPDNTVYGPGLFGLDWNLADWRTFLYGTHEERKALLSSIEGKVTLVVMPYFYNHYKLQASIFVQDPCFKAIENTPFLQVVCTKSSL